MTCEHRFEQHYLIRTSFGAIAWAPASVVDSVTPPDPFAWRCVRCGEQGYLVRSDAWPWAEVPA